MKQSESSISNRLTKLRSNEAALTLTGIAQSGEDYLTRGCTRMLFQTELASCDAIIHRPPSSDFEMLVENVC
jgi:hypothetical protein